MYKLLSFRCKNVYYHIFYRSHGFLQNAFIVPEFCDNLKGSYAQIFNHLKNSFCSVNTFPIITSVNELTIILSCQFHFSMQIPFALVGARNHSRINYLLFLDVTQQTEELLHKNCIGRIVRLEGLTTNQNCEFQY